MSAVLVSATGAATCNACLVKYLSFFALGSMVAAASLAAGCVGDDPAVAAPVPGPDGSAPCTGAGCVDGGGGQDSGTNDSGSVTDANVDATPPACAKIQVTTLAGSVEGSTNGAGNVATFKGPEGITVDPATGTLFVADTGNQLVRKVLADGTTTTFSTTTSGGPWLLPRHASYSTDYNGLFVSDPSHDQAFAVAPNGAATSDLAISSLQGFVVQPTTFQKFVITPTLVAKGTGGTSATAFSGDLAAGFVDGPAAGARYQNVLDLAFDGVSDLYVADQGNHRIRKVNVTAGASFGDVATVAGAAAAGHVDGTGAAARFEGPNALAIDSTKHLIYVADGATIRIVTAAGAVSTLVGSSSAFADGDGCTAKFVNARGITKFANELYVLDVNRIRKIVMN